MVSVSTLFGRPRPSTTTPRPGVVVGLDHVPAPAPSDVEAALRAIEPLPQDPTIHLQQDLGTGNLLGLVEMGPHRIEIVGLNQPAPEALVTKVIESSHWDEDHKVQARDHQSHVLLEWQGEDTSPLERYLAVYKVIRALAPEGVRAIFNEAAWTFNPGGMLEHLLTPNMLAEIRRQIPPNVFTGFVALRDDIGVWYVTKGNHVFGVPDLAFLVPTDEEVEPNDILHMFMNVFLHVYESDDIVIGDGHTLELPHRGLMRVAAAADVPAGVEGPAETYILEPVG